MAVNVASYRESPPPFPSALLVGNLYQDQGVNGGGYSPIVPFPRYSMAEHPFTPPIFPFPDTPPPENWTRGDNGTSNSSLLTASIPTLYSSPATVFLTLLIFSAFTIFGNSLVMLAVKKEHYLKSPPNYFIASLAAADFSVGILLMPFEAITQLLNRRWIFGEIWCDLWHSFDVLLTTASILNLCVISLDRYWAICTPLHYSWRMTSKRAFRFIALVWICAIVISLPAIFWWRSVRVGPVPYGTCPFTDDVSYLVSSSCISFYIPLSVMIFTYYKIYLAATKQSKSIQQGIKQFSSPKNGTDITLRMHRGGTSESAPGETTVSSTSPQKTLTFGRSDSTGLSLLSGANPEKHPIKKNGIIRTSSILKRSGSSSRRKGKKVTSSGSDSIIPLEGKSTPSSNALIINSNTQEVLPMLESGGLPESGSARSSVSVPRVITDSLSIIIAETLPSPARSLSAKKSQQHQQSNGHSHNHTIPNVSFRRHSRRSFTVARKLAKFAKEKKAAKTLAIVLGVFIICWLPFFVINIVFALCRSCAEGQMVIFEVATWLGWINSAMNPVIYACWSHDFRRAFARLLCCARCGAGASQWSRSQRSMSVV